MDVADRTVQPAHRYTFHSIPNELIEYHIFGYFWFHYWTKHFVSVCKRWKQICENATITPKHLRISLAYGTDIGKAMLWVKKYQPTILELNFVRIRSSAGCDIELLVGASECIDTLILDIHDNSLRESYPSKALSKIRTLFWKAKVNISEQIFKFFPSLQRLQLQYYDNALNDFPVEELTIIEPTNFKCLKKIDVPKLTVIMSDKVYQKIDRKIREIHMDDMTYEQYFRYFGKTKLYAQLTWHSYEAAAKLLEHEVSYEYESDLVFGYYLTYDYPTNPNHSYYDHVFTDDDYWQNGNQFPFSNRLPVSNGIRFMHMVHTGDVDAAVKALAFYGTNLGVDLYVARSFFNVLLHPKFNATVLADTNVRAIAKAIIESDISNGWKLLKTLQQFDKIADLVDWSKTFANTKDYDLFWAMIDKGAQMPYQIFRENILCWFSDSCIVCSEILNELSKRDPLIWYDILSITPHNALEIMKRFNIYPLQSRKMARHCGTPGIKTETCPQKIYFLFISTIWTALAQLY